MVIIKEAITNGYTVNILDIFSLFAILCGILVILSKNPIVSVLFLIGLFASISCYLFTTGSKFIGLSYLIVYIGAVSILFLFILMLINIRTSELQSYTRNSIPLAIIIAIYFFSSLFHILPYDIATLNNKNSLFNSGLYYMLLKKFNNNFFDNLNVYDQSLSFVTSNIWDANLAENSHITSIGNIMYTNYNLWLIITSFILLLAMVGAIVITINPTKKKFL